MVQIHAAHRQNLTARLANPQMKSPFPHTTLVIHPKYRTKTYVDFMFSLPNLFLHQEGEIIYKGRNELRRFNIEGTAVVVKSFRIPNIINRFVYGIFRPSKAKRAYENALKLIDIGIGTPFPIGYLTIRHGLLFTKSYFVSLQSPCPYVYNDLFYKEFYYADDVLTAVGETAAKLHEHGYAHKDFGRGNILFMKTNGGIKIDIVDINRLHIGKIDMYHGCKNLERLPATPHYHHLIANAYARVRGFDADECYNLLRHFRSLQPGKINGLY